MSDTNGKPKLDIQKEAVCLSLKLGMLRTRRKVEAGAIETDADRSLLHIGKEILESTELKVVDQYRNDIKKYLKSRCLPSPFRSGVYLIRLTLVEEAMAFLTTAEEQDKANIQTFMTFYREMYEKRHDLTNQMSQRLGSLYKASDYPDPRKVEQSFIFEVQLWELSTPGSLRTIDRALYEREKAKMDNVWEQAQQQITQVLLTEFRDMTARMAERLAVPPDGKPKVFRDSLVGNLQEWLDLFEKRDLAKDEDLQKLVVKARAMVSGLKPEVIRDSEALRTEIATEMQKITAQLDQAIVERPGRKIELDEEVPA
jgi:hypothetical protein